MTVWPNLYVVGAPRCGTTALCQQLSAHPDIFFPEKKEFHYFATDLDLGRDLTDAAYAAHYASTQARWRGDGSTWHLFSHDAATNIRAASPDAKIIIILRPPDRLVESLINYRIFTGQRLDDDFDALLTGEANHLQERVNGAPVDTQAIITEAARFSDGVRRYLDTFSADNVLVLLKDDFDASREAVLDQIAAFLDLTDPIAAPNAVVNEVGAKRSQTFAKVIAWRPWFIRRLFYALPKSVRTGAYQTLNRANTVTERKAFRLSDEQRRTVLQTLAEDVRALERLIDRDLSAWTQTS